MPLSLLEIPRRTHASSDTIGDTLKWTAMQIPERSRMQRLKIAWLKQCNTGKSPSVGLKLADTTTNERVSFSQSECRTGRCRGQLGQCVKQENRKSQFHSTVPIHMEEAGVGAMLVSTRTRRFVRRFAPSLCSVSSFAGEFQSRG